MFDDLTDEQLVDELAAQAAELYPGTCRFLQLAAACKERLDWSGDGATFAQWVAWRCSLRPRHAREQERVADRLGELPLIREAFSRGELSYGKVSTLIRVAEPSSDQKLVELAGFLTASQLERAVGASRRVTREEAADQQDREFLNYFWQDDGSFSLSARLAADDGAVVLRALEAGREALREQRPAERARSPPNRRRASAGCRTRRRWWRWPTSRSRTPPRTAPAVNAASWWSTSTR